MVGLVISTNLPVNEAGLVIQIRLTRPLCICLLVTKHSYMMNIHITQEKEWNITNLQLKKSVQRT
jgi:hypothetical protein